MIPCKKCKELCKPKFMYFCNECLKKEMKKIKKNRDSRLQHLFDEVID